MNLIKKRNFPCKCSHEAKLHESVGSPIWENWCGGKLYHDEICRCPKYVPDNLKYLEEIYKKNNGN